MMQSHTSTAAAWGWNPVVDRMDAEHCRKMVALGAHVLARLGWSDADFREMSRKACAA